MKAMRNETMVKQIRRGNGPAFSPLFLRNKKRAPLVPEHIHSYYYRNFTVCVSIEMDVTGPVRLLSIVPHGFDHSPLPDSEMYGLLHFFGFEEKMPLDGWEVIHPGDDDMGNTRYYMQQAPSFVGLLS